ncbi:right-handed parallel beta-helix repeat-containing protein [Isoptericola sp. b441]|uniref:Right-handed parallel beta-helix repeat-containing protein n=1 Tax=Actinotalea lenta TaxID=3064654 RepID=A0ABT9DC82_9CELL|nr:MULTISPECIES: right-handed parallel beta-helix repeat-containing protein [unclassified Isoptericola]MDO8106798.1 right-handed parallel beta-helix repeat-containing protein [Isoptericola sp. b441]MDO8121491.1 right-handed parallel beta-helix repeat-containing protein [Isoptericola sp. b490]
MPRTWRAPRRTLTAGAASLGLALVGLAPAAAAVGTSPIGNVDQVGLTRTGIALQGWAADADSTGPVTVDVTVDGATTAVRTGAARPDVSRVYPQIGGHQGFDVVVPASPGRHTVCATVVNVGPGSDRWLGCRTLVHPGSGVVGHLDSTVDRDGAVAVRGWADRLMANAHADVHLTLDGATAGTTSTGLARPDVPRVYPGMSSRAGFRGAVKVPAGRHELCVVAASGGATGTIGCTPVSGSTASAPSPTATPAPAPTPQAGSVGVPAGTHLTVHQGDMVITKDGTLLDGLDIRGYVTIRARDVVIRNSVIRGGTPGTSSRGLVTVPSAQYSLTIEDSTLAPTISSPLQDGIRGMSFTARRVEIRGVVDGAHLYGDHVTIANSWLHGNTHFAHDPNHGGGPSHDDSIQIQTGTDITIAGNRLEGATNAALMVTQDGGPVSNLVVKGNFLDDGACVVNIKDQGPSPTAVSIRGNTFGRHARWPSCGIKVPNAAYQLDLANNAFTDGAPVGRTP